MFKANQDTSAERRTSAERPRPGAEPDQHPLEGDRFAINEAIARREAEYERAHSKARVELEEFSHPACAGLSRAERRSCPLSSVRWSSLRSVEGGVELESFDQNLQPMRLRWQLLCHIAFARSQPGSAGCPLGTDGLQVRVLQIDGRTTVRLIVQKTSLVDELRRQVRAAVSPR